MARSFIGIKEIPGAASQPVILQWAKDLKAPDYTNDDTPWCALFLNRVCLACQLPLSGSGYELLRAKSFLTWGQPLSAPALGAVLVFKRPEGFHVGLYVGERADAYCVLGGNQGNSVGLTWIAKDRLEGCRWPADMPLPAPAPVLVADAGVPLSTNEA
ncbi:MAG TPA: TIGR02594 family protein [Vicinamibacterales bacterium]|nr:TIGR02594 family protein [Vicinamibacterales bacterium]